MSVTKRTRALSAEYARIAGDFYSEDLSSAPTETARSDETPEDTSRSSGELVSEASQQATF